MKEFVQDLRKVVLTKFGDVLVQLEPPKVRAAHCRHLMQLAEPGMVICRKYRWYADSLVIPGEYSHSGLVESKDTVLHAIAEGVQRDDILDFVKDADGFILIRFHSPPYLPLAAINRARSQFGTNYDFNFSIMDEGKALYCHEHTAEAVMAGDIMVVPELKTIGQMTREVYTADCFITQPYAEIVYEAQV